MKMESSEPSSSSLFPISLCTDHTTPCKPSLSTSLPIRAALTLDDDSESNDDDSDSVHTVVSLSVSEFECNEDEDFDGFADNSPFVGSGLKRVFIRPFAPLSWDQDGDFDDHGCGDFSETETVVVPSEITAAPRVKGFGNGFWGDREECDENVVLMDCSNDGVLEDCEEFGLEALGSNEECFVVNSSVQDLGFDEFCPENAKVEEYDVGVLEACDFEEPLGSNEEKSVEKSSIQDLGFDKFCVENGKVEEYDVGVLEDCEEFSLEALASNEEGFVENILIVDSGFGKFCVESAKVEECSEGHSIEACDYEEQLVSNEEGFAENSLIVDSGFEQFCVENAKFGEYEVGVLGDCEGSSIEACNFEEPLVLNEEGFAENSSDFDKFCVENPKIEEYDVGVLEACKPLGLNEEGFVEKSCVGFDKFCVENGIVEEYDVGVLGDCEGSCTEACDYEAPLASNEENFAEKSTIQNADFDKFCIENPTVEEYDSGAEFDALETSRSESDMSGFPLSETVEDSISENSKLTEVIVSKTEQNKIEKIRLLRVKFLKLVHRIGLSIEDPKVTRALEKTTCGFPKQTSHFGTIESAKKKALEECEAENQTDLDSSLNILVLGKSGVGKSATINLIFGEKKSVVNAFEPATTLLQEIIGTINGVKIKILDTPGLKVHISDQSWNRKLLANLRKRLRNFRPDIVLYVDRLDTETTETDKPMLKSITASLGSSIWKNAIVTLTHSSSARSRSHGIFAARKKLNYLRDSIGEANRLDRNLLCPVSLVENHPLISKDSNGRSDLLLLCYSIKVLSEANVTSRPKRVSNWKEVLGFTTRSLLTSLLHLNLCKNSKPNNVESEDDPLTCLDSSNLGVQAVGDRISCRPRNGFKTIIGLDIASRPENVFNGFKNEDPIPKMYIRCGGHAARGPNSEACNSDESPLMGLGFMVKCRGDMALSATLFLRARFAIGRCGTNVLTGLELNHKRHSRIVVGTVGSDQLHIALIWVLQLVIPFFLSNH